MNLPADHFAGDDADRPRARTFLREWRLMRGLNLRELSEKVGLSAARCSQIEQGKEQYNQKFLENCARSLDCAPADILFGPPGARRDSNHAQIAQIRRELDYVRMFVEHVMTHVKLTDEFLTALDQAPPREPGAG